MAASSVGLVRFAGSVASRVVLGLAAVFDPKELGRRLACGADAAVALVEP